LPDIDAGRRAAAEPAVDAATAIADDIEAEDRPKYGTAEEMTTELTEYGISEEEQADMGPIATVGRIRTEREKRTDSLTGLKNFFWLEEQGIAKKKEEGVPEAEQKTDFNDVPMFMLDADKFTQVNNTYGHAMGNRVLRSLGGLLKARLAGLAEVARYGGEEIVLVPLTNASKSDIMLVTHKAKEEFKRIRFDGGDKGILTGVSFSGGYGIGNKADDQMYKAKDAGRDQLWWGDRRYEPGEKITEEISPAAVPGEPARGRPGEIGGVERPAEPGRVGEALPKPAEKVTPTEKNP
jgi:diguanylate cyclase (GGDEF)-like protein